MKENFLAAIDGTIGLLTAYDGGLIFKAKDNLRKIKIPYSKIDSAMCRRYGLFPAVRIVVEKKQLDFIVDNRKRLIEILHAKGILTVGSSCPFV